MEKPSFWKIAFQYVWIYIVGLIIVIFLILNSRNLTGSIKWIAILVAFAALLYVWLRWTTKIYLFRKAHHIDSQKKQ